MNSPDPQLTESLWNSLKMLIIILAVLGPVIIAILAIRIRRIRKRLISQHQINQGLIDKRMETYDRIGPKLNDILCFYTYTGNWQELTPDRIMSLKRDLDKDIRTSIPLFSDDLLKKYDAFMQVCFVSFSGWEHQEKIKSLYGLREELMENWDEKWIPYFDTNNVLEGIVVKERYEALLASFQNDLNLLSPQST